MAHDPVITALSNCAIALSKLATMTADGACWCQVAIGNPMLRTHSPQCLEARRAIEALAVEGQRVLTAQ